MNKTFQKLAAVLMCAVMVWSTVPAGADNFDETLRRAQRGDAKAQHDLAIMYIEAANYSKAAEWYAKAADQGYALSQINLGLMYEVGLGVEQDYYMAGILYLRAAKQGNEVAQELLNDLINSKADILMKDERLHKDSSNSRGSSSGSYSQPASKPSYKAPSKCLRCSGTGKDVCSSCHGYGKIEMTETNHQKHTNRHYWISCRHCGGTGKVNCIACGGTGIAKY